MWCYCLVLPLDAAGKIIIGFNGIQELFCFFLMFIRNQMFMRIPIFITFIFLLGFFSSTAQERQITGQITAKDNSLPVSGASIIIEGTKKGTTSNADGAFSITVAKGARLTISSRSYAPQTIEVGDQLTLTVILEPASNNLD